VERCCKTWQNLDSETPQPLQQMHILYPLQTQLEKSIPDVVSGSLSHKLISILISLASQLRTLHPETSPSIFLLKSSH
jgi:hypothetical protein